MIIIDEQGRVLNETNLLQALVTLGGSAAVLYIPPSLAKSAEIITAHQRLLQFIVEVKPTLAVDAHLQSDRGSSTHWYIANEYGIYYSHGDDQKHDPYEEPASDLPHFAS